MWFTLVAGLLVGYAVWSWVCLERNVQIARRMGLPLVRLPVTSTNVLWMIFEPNLWRIVDALPIPWSAYPESFRYLRRGWPFYEKAKSHQKHGPIWALVSPVRIDIYLADPAAVGYVFGRRKDFVRPVEFYAILKVFGDNITSSDNQNWPRHRKALAAPFNESVMSMVWNETSKQARAVAQAWSRPETQSNGIASVTKDIRQMSLNTLASVGFGKSYEFQDSESSPEEESTYRATLQTVLDNAILLMLVPYNVLTMSIMPKSWQRIGRAGDAFRAYMTDMLDTETKAIKEGKSGSSGVIASLVRALDIYQPGSENTTDVSAKGLSPEEVIGNTFVINFAGHDTTANTLAFATLLLAAHRDVQDWVSQEIQQATRELGTTKWTYEALFEKLPRCRAVLFETVRQYPTTFSVPKATANDVQKLEVQGQSYFLPPKTGVLLNMYAVHHDPKVWPDATTWRPQRWIVPASQGSNNTETLYQPPPNTYFPWSDGQQNCPGRKFAEVEFVAIMATLLRDNRLEIKRLDGETAEKAQARLIKTINDVDFTVLNRMKDPDRVRLLYKKA